MITRYERERERRLVKIKIDREKVRKREGKREVYREIDKDLEREKRRNRKRRVCREMLIKIERGRES